MYLIIGASGFIGRHLYGYCKSNAIDVLGTYYSHCYNSEWIKFDICSDDLNALCEEYLGGNRFDAVIICGANASIDNCKKNEYASEQLNVINTQRILEQVDNAGMKCVFLSSEAVFDGKKGMYAEEDIPNPITLYGKQKLKIEQYITHNIENYLIFRISRAVGSQFGEKDIFNEFYNKMKHNEEIICLKNQSFCLTAIDDIVRGIMLALNKKIKGLYHLSSANFISRYELACLYGEKMFGGYDNIIEKAYTDIPFLDYRHIYGGLRGERLEKLLGIKYKSVIDIMDKYISSYISIEQK